MNAQVDARGKRDAGRGKREGEEGRRKGGAREEGGEGSMGRPNGLDSCDLHANREEGFTINHHPAIKNPRCR